MDLKEFGKSLSEGLKKAFEYELKTDTGKVNLFSDSLFALILFGIIKTVIANDATAKLKEKIALSIQMLFVLLLCFIVCLIFVSITEYLKDRFKGKTKNKNGNDILQDKEYEVMKTK